MINCDNLPIRKDPVLSNLPPLEEYASKLQFDRITEAIVGPPTESGRLSIADYDLLDLKNLVWGAAEKFLVRDIYDLDIDGVEAPYETELPSLPGQRFKGIIDLRGVIRGRLNTTKKYAGARVIIDWKTSSGTLDKLWEDRLRDSWQWKKYLYFDNADVMFYRGLNREGKTREIIIERPAGLEKDLLAQLAGVTAMKNALVAADLSVWPRRMPSACGAFGRECPRLGDCQDGTMVRGIYPANGSLSYSSMDKLLLCPERHRADKVSGVQDDTEESLFGSAAHRGLAELYQQATDLFIKTKN